MAENILYGRQGTSSEDSEAEDLCETSSEDSEAEDLCETSSEDSEAEERFQQIEIREEEINVEKKIRLLCEMCVREDPSVSEDFFFLEYQSMLEHFSWRERWPVSERWFKERVAVYMCFMCEMYVCRNCLAARHRSHRGMKVGRLREMEGEASGSDRMEEESEGKIRLLLDNLMKESETERIEKFENSQARIYDRVYVKHELDRNDCEIYGLCGLENTGWVACDYINDCIKIFSLGSNVLQRYIRFVEARPGDVTEIFVNQNSTEPNLESGSRSEVSVTARAEHDKHCLVAVTLPCKRQIMFINLSKKPALLHKVIHTEEQCWVIEFYDGKIFTVCRRVRHDDFVWSVYIKSTDGVTFNKFGNYGYFPTDPYLAVVSGRVYLTGSLNNKVQCRNVEGQVLKEIPIKESGPVGISVDPDNNVYVCAGRHDKVYKLDADLNRYKSVLDQTPSYIGKPWALCYHRDKLFISHSGTPSLDNYVTVVQLL